MMGNDFAKVKKRNGTLIKIENAQKECFCIFCGGRADFCSSAVEELTGQLSLTRVTEPN